MTYRAVVRIAILSVAAGAAIIAIGLRLRSRDGFDARARLVEAASQSPGRQVPLRLSGFPYKPLSTQQLAHPAKLKIRSAAEKVIADRLELSKSTSGLRDLAIASLLSGKEAEAIELLKEATDREPKNADTWNDLAVVLHKRAVAANDPRTLGAALAAADRSIALNFSALEPRFNRAAILDEIGLRDAADNAWRAYCRLDVSSPWSSEARSHVTGPVRATRTAAEAWATAEDRLKEAVRTGAVDAIDAVISAFPREARSSAESIYLSDWAETWTRSRVDAGSLIVARVVGQRLAAVKGEHLLKDAVAAIDGAIEAGTGDDAARAHLIYRESRLLIRDRKPSEARRKLELAEGQFRALGSPMALMAAYYRAATLFDGRKAAEADSLLDDVEKRLLPGYKSLRAQIVWERARIAARLGKPFEAYQHASAATSMFEEIGEREFAARTRSQTASSLVRMGRPEEAWTHYRINFLVLTELGLSDLQEAALYGVFHDEIFAGRYDVARSIGDVLVALPSKNSVIRFDTLLLRTFLHEGPEALERIAAVRAAASKIPDNALREDAEDETRFAEAMLLRKSEPSRAVALLASNIAFNSKAGRMSRLRDAYVERARAHLAADRQDAAERDLISALTIHDSQSDEISRPDLRDTFLGSVAGACHTLTELYLKREAHEQAFQAAEQCRARSLRRASRQDLDVATIRGALGRGTTLLHYTVLDREVVVFAMNAEKFLTYRFTIDRSRLIKTIEALITAIQTANAVSVERITSDLSADLLKFPPKLIPTGGRLVIVPDGPLVRLPFAALKVPATDGPLVTRHTIVMAPSANGYVTGVTRVPPNRPAHLAAIGDPITADAATRFPRLPGAAREAREIAKSYITPTVLIGADATVPSVTQALIDADVIHIGTHAIAASTDVLASGLVLTPTARGDGVLYLRSLFELQLPRAPIVVLAGCRTASSGIGQGAIRSLAHGFLAAGSRAVIGSLWDVDDRAARLVSTGFHRRLLAGRPAADALRETQLELLNSNNAALRAPAAWAGYQLMGND